MKEMLHEIKPYLQNVEIVVFEAAHIYADEQPSIEHAHGACIASGVAKGIGKKTFNSLLIDDYNALTSSLDIDSYVNWLAGHGYVPDEVVLESDLVPGAHELLQEIKETVPAKKFAKSNSGPGLGIRTAQGRVPLITTAGKFSCSLLDAVLYIRKSKQGDAAITVLPKFYESQQLATAAVLKRANKPLSIVNVFFNPESAADISVLAHK